MSEDDAIRAVHFDVLDGGPGRSLIALWPAPVDADACLAEAGFTDFADSDAAWDAAWEALLEALLEALADFGGPSLRDPPRIGWWARLRGRVAPTPRDALLRAAEDDNAPPAVVDFGPLITLRVQDGHPLLWVTALHHARLDAEALAVRIAAGRPVTRTRLGWEGLRPRSLA